MKGDDDCLLLHHAAAPRREVNAQRKQVVRSACWLGFVVSFTLLVMLLTFDIFFLYGNWDFSFQLTKSYKKRTQRKEKKFLLEREERSVTH